MDFSQYINPEFFGLVPVLYVVGLLIKKSNIADKTIPWILGAVAIVLSVIYTMATSDISTARNILLAIFTAITQGILTAGAAVYFNQLVKQAGKSE